MFKAAVGHSDEIMTADAVAEVIARCEADLQGVPARAGLLFCATEYDHQLVVDRIMDHFPGLQLVGCTTDGEMSSSGGFTEDAISLALFGSDEVEFSAGYGTGVGADPEGAAHTAMSTARAGLDGEPRLGLVLPDGLTGSAYKILDGFMHALDSQLPLIGGMSADRVGGSKSSYASYQFCGREVLTDAVPVLLFGGSLLFSLGVESGWQPIGHRMTVTKAENNMLLELDGRPAFELYTHYLGTVMNENLAGLGSYPLAIYEEGLDRFYLRVPRNADPETGQIDFLGEIPLGAQVQITQAIRDQVIDGTQSSVAAAMEAYPGKTPAAAMLFSCTGRKIALGTKTREEVARVRAGVPADLPMCGFYTFGEIGPVTDQSCARYHNTTFVTVLMGTH